MDEDDDWEALRSTESLIEEGNEKYKERWEFIGDGN